MDTRLKLLLALMIGIGAGLLVDNDFSSFFGGD